MEKRNLKGLTLQELEEFMAALGEPAYRARQIFKWIYKGVTRFELMTDLPKNLMQKLNDKARISMIEIYRKIESSLDQTIKYVFLLEDGNMVEGVKMEYSFGMSACVSSQVGCRMGCAFCASAIGGMVRNLTAGEMADEVLAIEKDTGKKVGRVVVMGSGEPLLNYDELIKFLNLLNSPLAFNISFRRITISTCGIVPEIIRLADEGIPVTLAVSLHAPDDSLRNKLMPVNRNYPILQLLDACKYYIIKTKRRITFEYALISQVNDTIECAQKLSRLLKGMLCHVNLIPLNAVRGKGFEKSKPDQVAAFKNILSNSGISNTVRREMGADIEAACGQLRRSILDEVK
ncbi:MAG: rRNA (adenine2503-C2)-methyltransferase [Thermoanaerobacteraceae bacterium]|jgi:23S rRNA (adenine2503-C2)-methyltransferase|uniref:Probable dual-specificity RNA methyltransferase RlmN n=1 Tax=Biomaibacter acetigenes TaxID=2316383 RepID=A0A3G2R4N3_9FIRM|nr:23S rRNA (adenine(2503)-C(2))-methyltransferase RlmN [Biomaibacter acetigenes]MDK2877665.1 rRNA (adenine2503-C2)-methyltransferase [Thermoanaerobacteraceae bacterium]RKL63163.1 23S rRNA (adenine(2503)-C(2))-methyltransferase RlmN [Thermoanaerobacteraceae bacterium SP2]AYO30406.1 23S rRNA (adenine(2503)-C(2))-methyltransferase RlmN [Biomaibacter acetigenes]MDN5300575.1 rRNA (adenine2503-C2)-methyltransferase [Thermoanaerobacteraceae bacterium]MDN5312334.1 rRNA (adenine2503-C2)-methyltransfer